MTLVEPNVIGGKQQNTAEQQMQSQAWPAAGAGVAGSTPVPPDRSPPSAYETRAKASSKMPRYLANQCTSPLPQEAMSFAHSRRWDMPATGGVARPAAPQT